MKPGIPRVLGLLEAGTSLLTSPSALGLLSALSMWIWHWDVTAPAPGPERGVWGWADTRFGCTQGIDTSVHWL